MYTITDGKVYNENGAVAMLYIQITGKMVTLGDGTEYLFRTQNNVCMAWVLPEHVQPILNIKKSCCGNRLSAQFRFASEMDARIWMGMSARP